MNNELIEKLASIGFEYKQESTLSMESYWFMSSITELDLSYIKKIMGKNHFINEDYRGLFIGKITNIQNNIPVSFFYATSSIGGDFRKYRCKNSYETEFANIFASGETLDDCIEKFVYNYSNRIYNTRG